MSVALSAYHIWITLPSGLTSSNICLLKSTQVSLIPVVLFHSRLFRLLIFFTQILLSLQ